MSTKEQRLRLAKLIEDVAERRMSPARALEEIETESWHDIPWKEKIFRTAFHALQHFHIDEDIRTKDPRYDADLTKGLLETAAFLKSEEQR